MVRIFLETLDAGKSAITITACFVSCDGALASSQKTLSHFVLILKTKAEELLQAIVV